MAYRTILRLAPRYMPGGNSNSLHLLHTSRATLCQLHFNHFFKRYFAQSRRTHRCVVPLAIFSDDLLFGDVSTRVENDDRQQQSNHEATFLTSEEGTSPSHSVTVLDRLALHRHHQAQAGKRFTRPPLILSPFGQTKPRRLRSSRGFLPPSTK